MAHWAAATVFQKGEELSFAHSSVLVSNQVKPRSMKFHYLRHRWVPLTSLENKRQTFLFRMLDLYAKKSLFQRLLQCEAPVTCLSSFAQLVSCQDYLGDGLMSAGNSSVCILHCHTCACVGRGSVMYGGTGCCGYSLWFVFAVRKWPFQCHGGIGLPGGCFLCGKWTLTGCWMLYILI